MSQKPKLRSHLDRARAAQRLACDGVLRPVGELNKVSGASPQGLIRWIREGRSGVYLDGIHDPTLGWCSTVAAVQRFLRELAEKKAERAEEVAGEVGERATG